MRIVFISGLLCGENPKMKEYKKRMASFMQQMPFFFATALTGAP